MKLKNYEVINFFKDFKTVKIKTTEKKIESYMPLKEDLMIQKY